MSFNGSGSFLINTAGQPVVSGTVISSTAFNALTADLATGLSTCITKDGQTTVTANIPMANYKFTGLGAGSGAADSANLSQVQSTVVKLLASVSGTDTITAVGSPTVAAYAAGQMFYFVAAGDNTGAVTINIDSLGAKNVTRDGSVALEAGDIKSGEVVVIVYDGTRFQVVSQLNSSGDARFANVSIASSLYVGGVATIVGNAGFSANVSIASALSVGATATITGTVTGSKFIPTGNVTTGNGMYLPTTNTLAFSTNGTEALRIDASQNAGLGVTPSTWTTYKAIEIGRVGNTIAGYNGGTEINIAANAYYNSAWKYAVSGAPATRYMTDNSGGHYWYNSASGTAGNAITFTQAMTLNASGVLLVNGTSAGSYSGQSPINVLYQASVSSTDADGGTQVLFGTSTYGADKGSATTYGFKYNTAGDYVTTSRVRGAKENATDGNFAGYLAFDTRANGGSITERARITSGGDFLVNATATASYFDGKLNVYGANAPGLCIKNDSGAGAATYVAWNTATTGNNLFVEFPTEATPTVRGSISYNRAAGQVAYNITSDARLKENIADAEEAGSKIDAMQVRQFDWKETGNHLDYGFVAQELHAVAPHAVSKPEDEEAMWSVDYSKLVPMLIKEVQSLRKRVAELETK